MAGYAQIVTKQREKRFTSALLRTLSAASLNTGRSWRPLSHWNTDATASSGTRSICRSAQPSRARNRWSQYRQWKIDLIEKMNPDWRDLYLKPRRGFW